MNNEKLDFGNYSYNSVEILSFCECFEDLVENKHETLDKMLRNSY